MNISLKTIEQALREQDQPTLLKIKEFVIKLIKEKSKANKKLNAKWDTFRKAIKTNMIFVKKNKHGSYAYSALKQSSFSGISDLEMEVNPLDDPMHATIKKIVPDSLVEMMKPITNTGDSNIYIAIFSKEGFTGPKEEQDIVYVGETRKQKTGHYRKPKLRWGFSGGNDHGAVCRKIFRQQILPKEATTRIDSYLARYDFYSHRCIILMSTGVEKEVIKAVKDLSKSEKFFVVNK